MRGRLWILVPVLLGAAGAAIYVPEMEEARDFLAYREAASLIQGDGELYETGYIYPPTFAFLFRPFASLSVRTSAVLWYGLNVALLAGSLWMASRIAGLSGPWSVLPLLFIFRFANNTLRSGQSNILILFLVCLSGYLFSRQRKVWAAIPLSLATAIKVTPGLLLVYHALQRRWRTVAAGGVGLLIFLLLPGATAGFGRTFDLLDEWKGMAFTPYLQPGSKTPFEEPETGYIPGHSVRATIHRLLRPIDASPHDEEIRRVNLLSLSRGTAEAATLVVTLLFAAAFVWSLRGGGGTGSFALEFALGVLFCFVLSPYVRKGHGTLLLVPYAVAIAFFRDPDRSARARFWTGMAIGASFALASLTGRFVLGTRSAAVSDSLSALLWGSLVLLLWGIVTLRGEKGRGEGGSATERGPDGDGRRR